jgi:hypothetical protein
MVVNFENSLMITNIIAKNKFQDPDKTAYLPDQKFHRELPDGLVKSYAAIFS